MKKLTHPAMLALGAAVLCVSSHIAPFIAPNVSIVFHVAGSPYSVFVPVLLNLLALWIVLAILLWLGRNPGWLQTLVWTALIVLLPLALILNWFAHKSEQMPHWVNVGIGLSPLLVLVLFLIARNPSHAPSFQKAQAFTAVVLGFVSLSACIPVAQLLWRFYEARSIDKVPPLHAETRPHTPHRSRVIWILFDELSYQQVYERRFPGLQLPGFDQLAQQSVVFNNTVQTAFFTNIAIPSMMTGMPADLVRLPADGHTLVLHNPVDGSWRTLDPHNTVFQDALNAGYKTAVAGWYIPYCRILPQVLDECFWSSYETFRNGIFPRQPVWWNAAQIPLYYSEFAYSWLYPSDHLPSSERNAIHFHQLEYAEVTKAADKILDDPSIDFVFLHLPVPHAPWMYDRRKRTFADGHASYVDNLALADVTLRHLRQTLEEHGQWDSSTVIVMGDHSWRNAGLKQQTPDWSNEDVAASHNGEFDNRPAYIVKFPYQQSSVRLDQTFEAFRTRALLDSLLTDEIKTPAELEEWVAGTQ